VLLLVCVLSALAARLWATTELTLLTGPNHLAASAESLYVHFGGSLYELDAAGSLKTTTPLSALGVEGTLADMQALREGDLLIGDQERGAIRRCTLATRSCRGIAPADATALKQQFKFAADEQSGRLYLADTRRHRLLVQLLNGGELRELTSHGLLKFPNEVWTDEHGTVYVADTNHHRVIALTPDGEESGFMLFARNGVASSGYTWPVSFARGPLGNWWVLNANGRLENAELIVYDAAGAPQKRVALPPGADPVVIARFGGDLVLSDRALFRLYRVDPRSAAISAFGGADLERALSDARARAATDQAVANGALALLGLLTIAAFVLGARVLVANQRARPRMRSPVQPSTASMSRFGNVYWLPREPAAEKLLRTMKRQLLLAGLGLIVLTLVALTGLVVAVNGKLELLRKCDPEALKLIALLAGYIVLTLPVLLVLSLRALATRIGSDGAMLYFADHRDRVVQIAPEEAVYTKRALAFRSLAVPLKLGNGRALYAEHDLQQHLQPLLERAQKLGEINMMIYQLMHGHPLTLASLVFLGAGVTVLTATGLWKIFF
jgi:hypothetical protein